MPAPYKKYLSALDKKFGYVGSWLPGDGIRLGDVGFFKDQIWRHVTSLQQLGVTDLAVRLDDSPSPFTHTSENEVEVSVKAAGEASTHLPHLPQAKAGVGFTFKGEGAFVFQIKDGYEDQLADIPALERAVRELFSQGRWDKSWHVVTQLVRTDNFTTILAESTSATVELSADAELQLGNIDISSAQLGLTLAHKSGKTTEVLGIKAVPLFRTHRLRHKWFAPDPTLEPLMAPAYEAITPSAAAADDKVRDSLLLQPARLADLD